MSRIVVLVSGRGSNLQALIDASESGKIKSQIVCVISNKDSAFALKRAEKAQIPRVVIPSAKKDTTLFFQELQTEVLKHKPDWIVLAGFMKILPKDFVKTFEQRIINIHPSLLPKFKGLDAQAQALEAKETITGCTVHFVDEGCDTGPIILQKSLSILPEDTVESLSARLLPLEHEALVEAMQVLEAT